MTWGQSRQCCYWFLLVLMPNGGDHSEWAFKTAIRSIWPRASVVLRHLDLLMILSVQESSPFRFYSSFSRLGELLSPSRTSVCCVMPRPVASWPRRRISPVGYTWNGCICAFSLCTSCYRFCYSSSSIWNYFIFHYYSGILGCFKFSLYRGRLPTLTV